VVLGRFRGGDNALEEGKEVKAIMNRISRLNDYTRKKWVAPFDIVRSAIIGN
jgi:hypothetical protein